MEKKTKIADTIIIRVGGGILSIKREPLPEIKDTPEPVKGESCQDTTKQ